jgi:iron complex outermembrane receptor protein
MIVHKKKPIALILAHAIGVGAFVAVPAMALAQSAEPVEKVTIVGSNIPRVAKEGAVPVVIITKADIEKSAASNVEDLVKYLGISGSQGFDTGASGSFVTGAASAGFRGLPPGDTLILLNGRRIAPYGRSQQSSSAGAQGFVDLNSLPLSAVEEVQILKDGASAVYGADAIAGVINIITKQNYSGGEVNIKYGAYDKAGGQEQKINATVGFGDLNKDRFNVLINAEAGTVDAIWNKDRNFTKTYDYRGYRDYLGDYRSSYSNYGNYSIDSGGYQNGSNCPPANYRSGLCRYDFGDVEQVQPKTDHTSALLVGSFKFSPDVKGFGEFGYNQNKTTSASRAPAMATDTDFSQVDTYRGLAVGTTQAAVSQALANQYLALGTDPLGLGSGFTTLDIRQRFTEFGPRIDNITTDSWRGVLGLKGNLDKWNWETAYTQSSQDVKDIAPNEINKSLLADLLVAGTVTNLFTDAANKGGFASARYVGSEETKSTIKIFDAKISGELAQLPAGPLEVAIGVESRKEDMTTTTDPITEAGLKLGSASVGTTGARDSKSIFAELNIPISSMLEAQLAARQDRYSDFGRTTNPKVAFRFQPTQQFLFRSSWGTAFKAPTLFQLYEAQSAGGYSELTDTLRCNATGGGTGNPECDLRLIEVRSGGVKPLGLPLNPERSQNVNFGFVWSPSSDFNTSVDFWTITKKDAIALIDPQKAIDAGSPAVLRGPTIAGVPGNIRSIISTYVNSARQELAGIDFDVNAKTKLANGSVLGGGLSATYNLKYKQWDYGSSEPTNLLGQYYYFEVPLWKAQARATYDVGNWDFALFLNYTHGYSNVTDPVSGAKTGQTRVEAYTNTDVTSAYKGFKDFIIRFGIRNLFDDQPAPIAGIGGPASDPTLYDFRGRFFYTSLNYKFK